MEDLLIDDYEIDDEGLSSIDYLEDTDDTVFGSKEDDEFLDEVMNDVHNKNGHEPSFEGSHYTDAEISKLRSEVSRTEYEMKCREHDVKEWEQKVSLNNTKEHIANGDYNNAVRHLNDAKSNYSSARSAYESAKSKLNNAL
jgi:uncharacterized protein YggL (DUF469 family)